MSAPILATPALSDLAALSGGDTAGSMPLSRLQSEQPSDRCRFIDLSVDFSGNSSAYIVLDFSTAPAPGSVNPNLLALIGSNSTSAAQVRYRAATTLGKLTSAPAIDVSLAWWPRADLPAIGFAKFPFYVIDPTIISPAAVNPLGLGLGTAYPFWRIDLLDPANPAGYLDVGRLLMASTLPLGGLPASCYLFPRGAVAGGGIDPTSPVVRLQTAGMQTYPSVRPATVTTKFSVQYVSEQSALTSLEAIIRTRSNSRSVLLILDPADPAYLAQKTTYGLLTSLTRVYMGYNSDSTPPTKTWNIDGTADELR